MMGILLTNDLLRQVEELVSDSSPQASKVIHKVVLLAEIFIHFIMLI